MRNNEVAEKVTADIIAALENGIVPWVQPWANLGMSSAINVTTGKRYRGVNTVVLACAQLSRSYQFSRWLTFKQARDAGGTVRKGEKGTTVIFWRFLEREGASGDKQKIPLLRAYTVFNVAQCDGLPEKFTAVPEIPSRVEGEGIPEADDFIRATGASIIYGGDRACYVPSADAINMPHMGQFATTADFYSTMFHELIHWTGHENRAKRQLGQRFGKEIYAAEELVAEIGAAFLCAEFGVAGKLQHASYIQSWIRVLQNDKNAIFTASRLAQDATDYLERTTGRVPTEAPVADSGESATTDED